jgi:DNA-binding transcriptional MocR family regulator
MVIEPSTPQHVVYDEAASAEWLATRLADHTANGIAATVGSMIRRGELQPGTRLPTIRALGAALGVSPATVSEAWSILRRRHALTGLGRQGTTVLGSPASDRPLRPSRSGYFPQSLRLDLRYLQPDRALLPPLSKAVAAALRSEDLNNYERVPITKSLRTAAAVGWPFAANGMIAVNGGYEGLHLLLQTSVVPGDKVAVEQPTAPRIFDSLESVGAEPVPVPIDERGMIPSALLAALKHSPVAVIAQPRAQSPTGCVVDTRRCAELAQVLRGSDALIIEDDGIGMISTVPCVSLGVHLPDRTVLVRSYSKSHGPDLRIAIVGGAATAVDRAQAFRSFGAGWTSRISQEALAWLLTDQRSCDLIDRARAEYAARRKSLSSALADRGITTENRDGLCLWVPVQDERFALVTLAAHGVAVSSGDGFHWRSPGSGRIRVSISTMKIKDVDEIADLISLAARPDRTAWARDGQP